MRKARLILAGMLVISLVLAGCGSKTTSNTSSTVTNNSNSVVQSDEKSTQQVDNAANSSQSTKSQINKIEPGNGEKQNISPSKIVNNETYPDTPEGVVLAFFKAIGNSDYKEIQNYYEIEIPNNKLSEYMGRFYSTHFDSNPEKIKSSKIQKTEPDSFNRGTILVYFDSITEGQVAIPNNYVGLRKVNGKWKVYDLEIQAKAY